jgi:hypothetical protein
MSVSNPVITDYWFKFYHAEHCTLCGNSGIVDTRGVRTPAGVEVGRLNWCICPNGQTIRYAMHGEEPTDEFYGRSRG